jgi:hypothetical protein
MVMRYLMIALMPVPGGGTCLAFFGSSGNPSACICALRTERLFDAFGAAFDSLGSELDVMI